MHYAVVMHVLPRLSGGSETAQALAPWPPRRTFLVAVSAIGAAASLGFAASFGTTRAVYAVFAAVHAWLEIPVLIVACALLPRSDRSVELVTA